MRLRTFAFVATIVAVLALLGSLVLGLMAPPREGMLESIALPALPTAAPEERIRVEVLNGAGISGLAGRVTDRLRAAGFDVVYYGNASGELDRDSTTILDRAGNQAAIDALSNAIDVERIESAIDTSLYLEATLIVAEDFENFEF